MRLDYLRSVLVFFVVFGWCSTASGEEKVRILQTGSQAGHYLQWKGKPILLIGDSVTQGWMETGANFDQTAYVDALASRGLNLLTLWSFIGTNASGQQADGRIAYDAPELWPWVGSPNDNSFDLTQLNQAYFDRLRALVAYAQSREIVVLITVHDGWPKGRFNRHPFNLAIGNGPLADRSQYVELDDFANEMPLTFNPTWTRQEKNQYFQECFCAKLIAELDSFSNVIYEMFNEGEWYDNYQRNQHEQHFLAFFRARCGNLLLTNTDHIAGDDPHNDPNVDVITLHGGWTGRFDAFQNGFNRTPAKPYLLSEPVPQWNGTCPPIDTIRRSVWEIALAGAGWVNQNDTSFGWDPNTALADQAAARDLAYECAGHCARFFNESGIGFSGMSPRGELSNTGVCLANVGAEYVIYSPSGGTFTVDLTQVSGALRTEWYDPRTGDTAPVDTVVGGAPRTFIAPDNNDWVLHIFHAPGDLQWDGRVDLRDFGLFQLCFGGSANPPNAACPPGVDADLDGDGDVDLIDFAIFRASFCE